MADATSMTANPNSTSTDPQMINIRQNELSFVQQLHAADAAHAQAQRWEIIRGYIAFASSGGAIVAAFARELAILMSFVGAGASIALWCLMYASQAQTKFATKIQERFDIELFGLPATKEFNPLPTDEEIGRYAARYRGDDKVDWYVDVTKLPPPYAILLCQRENLNWDWALRRKWASILSLVASGWFMLGLLIALAADWSTRELFLRWLIPSLPIFLFAATVIVKNMKVARGKQQMALEIEEKLSTLPAVSEGKVLAPDIYDELMRGCRLYQDQLFRLRDHTERAPGRIYRRYKKEDGHLAQVAATRLRARLLGLNLPNP